MNFIENMEISITEHLQTHRNKSIKKILDMLDMSDINREDKRKVRSVILEEINDFYYETCRVLTWIQEQNGS